MHSVTPFPLRHRRRRSAGFTLVEIMIVVVIIGFLASMAIPAFQKVRRRSQNTTFVNDLRVIRAAAEQYSMENSGYPPDGAAALAPEFAGYLSDTILTSATSLGGVWDWDYEQFGFKAGISVYLPTASADQLEEVDRMIDDGNLSTGNFRDRGSGYIYVIEF